ncbi:uncharacterized protein LOC136080082 [Hydra vulgaris]|uniref:Uncharacterized protein LOC136080082 n=1 Tax=Hydra vulgaris TaxID=6087 RepID=A0ABM4BUB2_HYDVU
MTTSEVFNFTEPIEKDNGIERYEEHIYEPTNGTNLNSPREIKININEQDMLTLPSKAYLLFEGQLVKADGTAYANAVLTNNGIMHLFNRITYQLSNKEIEAVYNIGQATTMLGMLNYANDFQLAQGLNQLWYKDSTSTSVLADVIHIFGFCDDYDKVIYGLKHTITLGRQSDDNAIFRLAGAAAGKVILNKIQLLMPNLIPSGEGKKRIIDEIKNKVTIPELPSQTSPENPRYVIVGFQTNRANVDQTVNASIFDHCELKNMFIMLNNNLRYPAEDCNLSFPNQQISRIYREASMFKERFYEINKLIANSNKSLSDYRDLYPIFVFDISKKSETLKLSTTQVQIRATFNTVVPANTQARALVLSDNILELKTDSNRINFEN